MGKTPVNTGLGEVRGKIDDWVFRVVEGETVIARRPRPRPDDPTENQKVQREVFRRANLFARGVFNDPVRKEAYRALAERRGLPASRLFPFIMGDYAQPPEITEVDVSGYHRHVGDIIKVFATDDGEVTGVMVAVKAADGTVLEQGAATLVDDAWRYAATTEIPAGAPLTVEATATDRPGHATVETTQVRNPGRPADRLSSPRRIH